MIEHHPVLLDASYGEWQAKCQWETGEDVCRRAKLGQLA